MLPFQIISNTPGDRIQAAPRALVIILPSSRMAARFAIADTGASMAPTPSLTLICASDVTTAASTKIVDAVIAAIEDANEVEYHNGREDFASQ